MRVCGNLKPPAPHLQIRGQPHIFQFQILSGSEICIFGHGSANKVHGVRCWLGGSNIYLPPQRVGGNTWDVQRESPYELWRSITAMDMRKTSRSIWGSGWSRVPVHRVDAYKGTEVIRAADQNETVFSGQCHKSIGKHSCVSGGDANHGGTSFNGCSFPAPDPCGLCHQLE